MLGIDFEARGAVDLLDDVTSRLNRPEQLLGVVVDEVHKYEQNVFDTQGNGTWPALSDTTVELKGSSRMLVDSGDLLAALTSSEDLLGEEAAVTADVAYAGFHKRGTSRMPRRDPAPEPPQSVVDDWAQALLDEIVQGHR